MRSRLWYGKKSDKTGISDQYQDHGDDSPGLELRLGLTSQNSRIRIKILNMMSRPLQIEHLDSHSLSPLASRWERSVDEGGRGR